MRWLALAIVAVTGCSSTADVGGDYAVRVTDESDGCNRATRDQFDTRMAIDQADSSANVTFPVDSDYGNLFLLPIFGTDGFDVTVDGSAISAMVLGTEPTMRDGCTFYSQLVLAAKVDGDKITGTMGFTPTTIAGPGCTPPDPPSCTTRQSLSATRLAM